MSSGRVFLLICLRFPFWKSQNARSQEVFRKKWSSHTWTFSAKTKESLFLFLSRRQGLIFFVVWTCILLGKRWWTQCETKPRKSFFAPFPLKNEKVAKRIHEAISLRNVFGKPVVVCQAGEQKKDGFGNVFRKGRGPLPRCMRCCWRKEHHGPCRDARSSAATIASSGIWKE